MKIWLKVGILLGSVLILTTIVFFYFPRIWGDILYPLHYEQFIVKYSQDFNVDPTLASAVIYTESHFNPNSISRVGARGLMQIMPATASGIAQRLGEKTVGDLFDPETNIRYGIFYLHEKLIIYNNNIDAVLTAYNAGGTVADRYVISRDTPLPYETVGFIRTVRNAQETYSKLYAGRLTENNIAEKLKTPKEPTLLERLVNFLGF